MHNGFKFRPIIRSSLITVAKKLSVLPTQSSPADEIPEFIQAHPAAASLLLTSLNIQDLIQDIQKQHSASSSLKTSQSRDHMFNSLPSKFSYDQTMNLLSISSTKTFQEQSLMLLFSPSNKLNLSSKKPHEGIASTPIKTTSSIKEDIKNVSQFLQTGTININHTEVKLQHSPHLKETCKKMIASISAIIENIDAHTLDKQTIKDIVGHQRGSVLLSPTEHFESQEQHHLMLKDTQLALSSFRQKLDPEEKNARDILEHTKHGLMSILALKDEAIENQHNSIFNSTYGNFTTPKNMVNILKTLAVADEIGALKLIQNFEKLNKTRNTDAQLGKSKAAKNWEVTHFLQRNLPDTVMTRLTLLIFSAESHIGGDLKDAVKMTITERVKEEKDEHRTYPVVAFIHDFIEAEEIFDRVQEATIVSEVKRAHPLDPFANEQLLNTTFNFIKTDLGLDPILKLRNEQLAEALKELLKEGVITTDNFLWKDEHISPKQIMSIINEIGKGQWKKVSEELGITFHINRLLENEEASRTFEKLSEPISPTLQDIDFD